MGWYLLRKQTLKSRSGRAFRPGLFSSGGFFLFLPVLCCIILPLERMEAEEKERQDHLSCKIWSASIPENNPRFIYYMNHFSSEKGLAYLKRCMDRAAPYRDFILSRLKAMNMPEEIFYLPVIESAYRLDAVSRSGAAGLWQFMMNSIAPYDIKVDAWRDERRDFWKSTEAALEKLKYNYKKTGDWLLALAAYNCGLGRIKRAMEASDLRDYWELCARGYLPKETENYIPKLAAVSAICSSKGLYGLSLNWKPKQKWVKLPLKHSVDIRKIASRSGMDRELVLAAHRELNYGVTPPPSGSYKLKVPLEYKEKIQNLLEETSELLEFKRYRIQSGDTLSELAQWYKIPLSMIREYNPGVSSRSLRIGQVLLIPLIHRDIPERKGIMANDMTKEWKGHYTVRKGDSLWGISRHQGVSPEEIALANSLPLNGIIKAGMVLLVPLEEKWSRTED